MCAGNRAEVLALLDMLFEWSRDYHAPPDDIAQAYAALRGAEQVFAWSGRDWGDRSCGLDNLGVNPIFDAYRDDPHMVELVGCIGATPASRD